MQEMGSPQTTNDNTVIVIDDINNIIIRDDHEFKLDPLIFKLLSYLRQNDEQVINRQQLTQNVWQSPYTSDAAINRSISELRKALGGPRNSIIKTLSKKGYFFSLPDNVSFEIKYEQKSRNTAQQLTLLQDPNNQTTLEAIKSQKPIVQTQLTEPPNNQSFDKQVAKLSPELSSQLSSQQTQKQIEDKQSTSAANKTFLIGMLNGSFLLVLIVVVVVTLSNKQSPQPPVNQPISVYVEKITHTVFNQKSISNNNTDNNTNEAKTSLQLQQSLHDQIMNAVMQIDGIKLSNQLTQNSNQFSLKSTIRKIGNQLTVALQLVKNDSQEYRYSTVLTFPLDDMTTATQQLMLQIKAILKLSLLKPQQSSEYISALNPLSHHEVFQLVEAAENLSTDIAIGSNYAYKRLTALNAKYPNTPEILGLMSRALMRTNTQKPFIQHDKHLQLEYANQALALDPKNLDAMLSLFYYQINLAHLRESAVKTASDIILFHPNQSKAWRAQLVQFIDSKSTCDEIKAYVKTIPEGIFKPKRLWVLEQILQACIGQKSLANLPFNANNQPNDRLSKAIYNNLYLFNIRNDNLIEVLEKRSRFKLSRALQLQRIKINYMTENISAANAASLKLTKDNVRYWTDLTQLMKSFYGDSPIVEPSIIDNLPYDYLESNTELHYISYINKMITQKRLPASVIDDYLIKRPQFIINVENHKEATALMMAQYLAGQITQSQATAKQLFEQLEQYRQQDKASFYFWSLGRYHLIARTHCGANCQTLTDQQYLSEVFAHSHTWWLDDLTFMQVALNPWQHEPLVKQYLQQVAQDKARIKLKQGL